MAEVLYHTNGKPVSEENPLPVSGIGGGMDPEKYYTKEESDNRFQAKGDYATTTQLGEKADKSYVDTELGKKADSSTLANKADKTVVDDLVARVEALEGGGA